MVCNISTITGPVHVYSLPLLCMCNQIVFSPCVYFCVPLLRLTLFAIHCSCFGQRLQPSNNNFDHVMDVNGVKCVVCVYRLGFVLLLWPKYRSFHKRSHFRPDEFSPFSFHIFRKLLILRWMCRRWCRIPNTRHTHASSSRPSRCRIKV